MIQGMYILVKLMLLCIHLLFAGRVIGRKPKPGILLPLIGLYVLMPIIWVLTSEKYTVVADALDLLLSVAYLPLIKLAFPKFKLRYLIVFDLFLSCYNILAYNFVSLLVGNTAWLDMGFVDMVVCLICLGLILSPFRHIFRQIYLHTSGIVLFVTAVILMVSWVLNYEIGFMYYTGSDAPIVKTLLVVTVITTAVLSIAFPFFMYISSSNRLLRTLSAGYEQQIHAQASHYQSLAASNYEIRRFRHDYRNTRIAIEKLLTDGNIPQALALLRNCEDALTESGRGGSLFDTGNGIVDALLTDKQRLATKEYAVIHFKGAVPADALSPTDLCVLLGNSVDNAIEACAKLHHDQQHIIAVECNCSSGFLFLTIKNPVHERVSIHNNLVFTTKENQAAHGFGIQSMHAVAKKYDGSVKLSSDDGYFSVSIELCLMGAVV